MSGHSITRRLTTSFALVMALVLLGGAVGIYFGERFALDRNLRRELTRQAGEIRSLVAAPGPVSADALRDRRESYVQVLSPAGNELAATAPLRGRQLLDAAQLVTARHGVHTFQRGSITNRDDHSFRIHTEVVADGSADRIVVVALRRDARDEALRELVGQLAIFVAAALALTLLVGYRLTRAVIRPVELLRAQAHDMYRGDATGRIGVPRTGDEIAALATTLNELLTRIAATVEQERTFAAAASHELRTPLAALKAELDLALRSPRSVDELRAAVLAASQDTERLIDLAEQLLLLRTPDTGVGSERVGLLGMVAEVAAAHDLSHVTSEDVRSDAATRGSSDLLRRALHNLLDNAERYGGTPITVHVGIGVDGNSTRITITDAGPGFPKGFETRAFDPFTRAPGAASGTGTGLGLAIVRAIATAHHGSAGAINTGHGASTWIELPAVPGAD